MAEWSIAAVLKTVEGHTSGGSNPSLSATNQSESAVTQKSYGGFTFYPIQNSIQFVGETSSPTKWVIS